MTAGLCPRCGAAASGRFCSECGASLAALTCPSCGQASPAGARFCNKCGAGIAGQGADAARAGTTGGAAAAATARGDGQVAWWLAGGMLVVLIVTIAWPVIKQSEPEPAAPQPVAPFAGGAGGEPGAGAPPDLSTMTPREAADRLYDRVMRAVSSGDEEMVQQFLPMALQAHELARPLDDDGLYHLATLKRAASDFAGAIATAEEGLADKPDHLLLLAAAADAADGMGDRATARRYWQHFLDVFDVQKALGLSEYMDHDPVLQESRVHARQVVGG
jgi:hypothetical protein